MQPTGKTPATKRFPAAMALATLRWLAAALVAVTMGATSAVAQVQTNTGFKLLFSSQQDLVDTWGKLHISVTPSDYISYDVPPSSLNDWSNRRLVGCFPLADGTWEVFSQEYQKLDPAPLWYNNPARWKLLRGITTDGVTFSNEETVIEDTTGPWTYHLAMAYNPDAGEYLLLKLRTDSNGFAYHAYFSSNGRQWQAYSGNPLFYEGDAVSLFWSPVLKKFVVVSKSFEQVPLKRIIDHSPQRRRVLMIRSSSDGRTWDPSDDLPRVWDDGGFHPSNLLTTPDAEDPPNLEYYSGTAFWYHDRAYMMVLKYTANPMFPNDHGEELGNEWWTSADGLNWERPARGVDAKACFESAGKRFDMGPMIIGGKLLWLQNTKLKGLTEDRISGVSARTNGEFSTRLFTMPDGDLRLNAAVPALDRPWMRRSPLPYLMAEVRDAQDNVIPGFERNKCVIWDGTTSPTRDIQVDTTDMPLIWSGASARQLAGQSIRLRFYFGGSTVYAITSDAAPATTTYTVTYHANGADSGTVPADQTKLHDVPRILAANSGGLVKSGFAFAGWNTAADGIGTDYAAGGTYTDNAAVTLYAQWVTPSSIYWDNSGGTTNDWDSVANWSTTAAGGITPAATPGATDVVTFSATPVHNTAQTVNLNANRDVQGLNVPVGVTASTTLLAGGTNRTLTIGSAGITNTGSGALNIGSATANQNVNLILAGNQSITANGSGGVTFANTVSGTGSPTLTNNGSGSGAVYMAGGLQSTVTSVVQDSATSALWLRGNNTAFTGSIVIKKGTIQIGSANSNLGIGGTLTLGNSAGGSAAATLEIKDNSTVSYAKALELASTTTGLLKISLRDDGGVNTYTFTGGVTGNNSLTLENVDGDDKLTFATGALNHTGTLTHIGTGAGDLTINSVIGTNVTGVIQNSATSRMILTGTNTYTGDTTVSAGTLVVDGDAIPNTGKLVIDGGKVDPSGATETVGTLFFGAVQQAAGTWGSTASTATNKNDTYFTGTGVVDVTTGPGGYTAWASTNGAGPNLNDDHDNDGVENGVEWFLGGNTNTTGFTPLPGVVNTSGTFSVTWTKSADYPGTYGAHFHVETSESLANPWTPATVGLGAGFVEITGNNVKFTFPAGPAKTFARLVITGP